MIIRHFRNTLEHIQWRKAEEHDAGKWATIDTAGALAKMGMQ
jgi:hypothetical protein